jgi:hypothetical protein
MKKTALNGIVPIAFTAAIVIGLLATSWYFSSFRTDDSWVANVNQLLEDTKPHPEWKDDYLMNNNLWLNENGSEQFIGATITNNTDSLQVFLFKVLSEANTQTVSSISQFDLINMRETNRVVEMHIRLGYKFPALNNHVWTVYFVLDDGLNQGLKGTIFVDRDVWGSEYGSGNWTGWKISPFPMVLAIIISVIIAAVGLGLLVFFKKRKHPKL